MPELLPVEDEAIRICACRDNEICGDCSHIRGPKPPPQPDWADVREAARKAGLTIELRFGRYKPGRYRHGMWTWRAGTAGGDLAANYRGRALRNSIELVGPRGSMHLYDPTPAEVMTAARLVGLGGDSDER